MARYRIRTAAGETFDVEGMAAINRHHPGATITHQIVFDALGAGTAVPYAGEQPRTDAPPDYEAMTVAGLREEIAARGIDVPSDVRKAELVTALVAADAANPDRGGG